MTNIRRSLAGDERGAVLVHVALAMLALIAFSALAVDYGALLVSRRQAQNSADAAALAGALSLAFDDPDDIPRAQAAAAAAGSREPGLGRGAVDCSCNRRAAHSVPARRARVCPTPAFVRTSTAAPARSNALPTFFAQIVGITSQDVRATATAQVRTGNAAECMKPWAVADKWDENWENGAAERRAVDARRRSSTSTRSRATTWCPIPP